jgi:hypothetical protein
MSDTEILECLDDRGENTCRGPVELRMPMSGTGRSFPRCEAHFEIALAKFEEINQRYPVNAPADFDYLDAGEHWDEDY